MFESFRPYNPSPNRRKEDDPTEVAGPVHGDVPRDLK